MSILTITLSHYHTIALSHPHTHAHTHTYSTTRDMFGHTTDAISGTFARHVWALCYAIHAYRNTLEKQDLPHLRDAAVLILHNGRLLQLYV